MAQRRPMPPLDKLLAAAQRFWALVDKGEGCWEWTGAARCDRGYGAFKICGRLIGAHNFSFAVCSGKPIPVGLEVCHSCDNPRCVRPDHLFLGTHSQNMRDASRKGRIGSRPLRRLTAEKREEIRQRWLGGQAKAAISRELEIPATTVFYVLQG